MTLSNVEFKTHLYSEHFFEMGVLLSTLDADKSSGVYLWAEIYELELKLYAYLDAIQIGGTFAIDAAFELLIDGDEDELLGALFTLFSLDNLSVGHVKRLTACFEGLLTENEGNDSFLSTLKIVKSHSLSTMLIGFLSHSSPWLKQVSCELLGYRGGIDPQRFWPLFHDENKSVKVAALVAMMRTGFSESVPAMEQAVLENKDVFNEHCIFPLLMLGSKKALQFSRLACQSEEYIKPQYPIYLALGGNETDLKYIVNAMAYKEMNNAVFEALGIFGSMDGVKILLDKLPSVTDEEKVVIGKSLNQILGGQLYETIEVTETTVDDINVEDITGKLGDVDQSASDDSVTIEVKQDCTDIDRWRRWLQENSSQFDPVVRYRNGKPYSFLLCLEEIAHPKTGYEDRQRAYNELAIRSGHHILFEPDWFVDKQIDALKQWQTWWNKNKINFNQQWMFNGQ